MYKPVLRSFIAFVVLAGNAHSGVPSNCDYSAELRANKSIVIDANTGKLLSARTEFPSRTSVDVLFVHKNPWAYQYSYSLRGIKVDGAVIGEGLKLLSMVPSAKVDAPEGEVAPPVAETSGNGRPVASCPNNLKEAATIARDAMATLKESQKESSENLAIVNQNVKAYEEARVRLLATTPKTEGQCAELVATGASALGAVQRAVETRGQLRDIELALEQGISRLKPASVTLAAFKATGQPQRCQLPDATTIEVAGLAEAADAMLRSAAAEKQGLAVSLKALDAQELPTVSAQLAGTLNDPASFIDRRAIGPTSEATAYDIEVSRNPIGDDKAKTTIALDQKPTLGRQRFFISAGLGVSFENGKSFGRQSAVIGEEVVEIVGVKSESDSQFGVVTQLNGQFWQLGPVSFGVGLGAAVTEDEGSADFGWFGGLSIGFLDDQGFVTFAYHRSNQTELAAPFAPGDIIPVDFEGDVPTTEKKDDALLVTLTMRVK